MPLIYISLTSTILQASFDDAPEQQSVTTDTSPISTTNCRQLAPSLRTLSPSAPLECLFPSAPFSSRRPYLPHLLLPSLRLSFNPCPTPRNGSIYVFLCLCISVYRLQCTKIILAYAQGLRRGVGSGRRPCFGYTEQEFEFLDFRDHQYYTAY